MARAGIRPWRPRKRRHHAATTLPHDLSALTHHNLTSPSQEWAGEDRFLGS